MLVSSRSISASSWDLYVLPFRRGSDRPTSAHLNHVLTSLTPDNHLLKYEAQYRHHENEIRRIGRNELAREGLIATEGELRKWRVGFDQRMADAKVLQEAAAEEAGRAKS